MLARARPRMLCKIDPVHLMRRARFQGIRAPLTRGIVRRGRLPGVALLVGLAAATALTAPAIVRVEDWGRAALGATGIPTGWKGQTWGSPAYDMTVVQEDSRRVLHLKSQGESSTITREVSIDVKDTPILEWRWKVVTLPKGADVRSKETDDEAIQLYVTFPRFPTQLRSRIIGYIWDTAAPQGSIVKSGKSGLVTYVVVRSGAQGLGEWQTETRNVYEDYKRIYGEEPGELKGISIAIDSDDTRSRAEAYIGEIVFRRK